MKRITNILYYLIIALFLLIIIYNSYVSIYRYKNHEDIPIGKISVNTIISGSMEPKIKVGSIVINIKKDNYKIDDIITFANQYNELVTHRIVRIDEGGYATKGDANTSEDFILISNDMIKGKVVFIIPFFGLVINAANGIIGRLVLLFLIALFVVLGFMMDGTNKKKDVFSEENELK